MLVFIVLVATAAATGVTVTTGADGTETVVINPARVRRVEFTGCRFTGTFGAAAAGSTLQLCLPPATTAQLGGVALSLDGGGVQTATNASTGAVLWRCLPNSRCLLGGTVPPDADLLEPGTVTVVGLAVTRAVHAWTVWSETVMVPHTSAASGGTATLQHVCLRGDSAVCGVRVATGGDTAVVVLRDGPVVVDVNGDVDAQFVLAALNARATVVARQALVAAERAVAVELEAVEVPVTGVSNETVVRYYGGTSTCARYQTRDLARYTLANGNCTLVADVLGFAAWLPGATSVILDCAANHYAWYTSSDCTGTATNATLPLATCLASNRLMLQCRDAT